MTVISNPSAPGAPSQVVAQSTPTAPLDGGRPWGTPSAHPAVAGFANSADAQITMIPRAVVDAIAGVPGSQRPSAK
jgi:hypothetical protein